MRVLMVAPGPPASGGKGYQVRLLNQIAHLTPRHEVSLVTFAPGGTSIDPVVLESCRSVTVIPWSSARRVAGGIWRSSRMPVSVALYRDPSVSRAVDQALATHRPDLVHVQLGRMAPYIRGVETAAIVLDLMDAGGLSMSERARAAPPLVRYLLNAEATRLRSFENEMARRAHRTLLISSRDQGYMDDRASSRVNPNGIDPRPALPVEKRDRHTLTFRGTMSYFPNADAVRWFASVVLPLVRSQVPDARFRIVGRNPGRAVIKLRNVNGIEVTGGVPSVFDELGRAIVAVCPLRYGSGLQTKILEAMAVGTPVIATSKAVEGLPRALVAAVCVADSPENFAAAVADTLREPHGAFMRADLALTQIRAAHTWRHSVDQLEGFYEEAVREFRSAAA